MKKRNHPDEFDASIDYNEDAQILKYIIKYIDFMV